MWLGQAHPVRYMKEGGWCGGPKQARSRSAAVTVGPSTGGLAFDRDSFAPHFHEFSGL
jgi:hypothetical protein